MERVLGVSYGLRGGKGVGWSWAQGPTRRASTQPPECARRLIQLEQQSKRGPGVATKRAPREHGKLDVDRDGAGDCSSKP